jgi:UDPglucose 6-dehydrogenase
VEEIPLSDTSVRVAVIGAGYVGLTTAVCLAHLGSQVTAVDVDEAKVEMMSGGRSPLIMEEGLEDLMRACLAQGRLSFTTEAADAVSGAEFVFLCLPTPQGADGAADLRFVVEAARGMAPHLSPGSVVVTKSTVPVGSAGLVVSALGRDDVSVVSNPEFLREGTAVSDWLNPDRVVIGCDERAAGDRLARLYEPLGAPVLVTDLASSETIKYACNAFLAAKVSFVNAIAKLCATVGADARDVILGMSYDRRIGADHLAPGPGWGGSCFPKDTAALIKMAGDHGYDFALLKEVVAANEAQFDWVADQVEAAAGGSLDGAKVAAWGLTFKAGTDDLRDSPALAVVRRLRARGAVVSAFDPTLPPTDHPLLADLGLSLCDDAYEAAAGAEVLVVLTEWPEFRRLSLSDAAAGMARPSLVDTRNMFEPVSARGAGMSYVGMGRS